MRKFHSYRYQWSNTWWNLHCVKYLPVVLAFPCDAQVLHNSIEMNSITKKIFDYVDICRKKNSALLKFLRFSRFSATFSSLQNWYQVEVCRSQHTQTWLGALYVYKGLLLVVGVYMAWETRHVQIAALNDSQYIGVSVYSVVITSAIVVVLANLIAERVTLAFITITALILTSTTATLCLLFLPKMNDIWGKGKLYYT